MEQLAIDELMSRAKCIPMRALANEIEAARDKGRYCIVFDKNENCPVFFTYKATMRDFYKETLAVKIGKKTKEEALEILRAALVYSMKIGDTFVINVDKLNPDFKTEWQDDEEFPLDTICDFDEWRLETNYLKIVKEDENKDLMGDPGYYSMHENFTMVFLARYETDQQMVEVFNNIPDSDMM